jgi:hypothetical protein
MGGIDVLELSPQFIDRLDTNPDPLLRMELFVSATVCEVFGGVDRLKARLHGGIWA